MWLKDTEGERMSDEAVEEEERDQMMVEVQAFPA